MVMRKATLGSYQILTIDEFKVNKDNEKCQCIFIWHEKAKQSKINNFILFIASSKS